VFPDEIERLATDAGERVSQHVVTGVPHEEIARFASERNADLIVMGQDNKTGMNNRLFDSVADKMIRSTFVPVLAVPDGNGECRVERMLLPIGDRIATDEMITHAATAATEFRMTIHVVKVVDTSREAGLFNAGGVADEFIERLHEEARPAIDRTIDRLIDLNVEAPINSDVVYGIPHEALTEYITAHDIDLVTASGYGGYRITRRVLGDITERLLQAANVPVLVV
jgi:nucleotide-binding universal stress UspA family protein